jgi:GTPase SAR1 family protein
MPPAQDSVAGIIDGINSLTITTQGQSEQTPQVQETIHTTEDPTASTRQPSPDNLNLLAKTQYARSARAINELRDLGIDRMEFSQDLGVEPFEYSLPKIALVGNQSSGKSSLIEAISQIGLPRDVGTCTRCPMEVRLYEGEEGWSCTVSLRRFNAKGAARTELFDKTTNRKDVELILRRAQLAILNQDKPVEDFVHLDVASYGTGSTRAFSGDMIVVDIVGAQVNVTFIDLPGITNPDSESDVRLKRWVDSLTSQPEGRYKKMIEELATSYLMDPNCLVLLTVSMQRTPFHKAV